MFFGFMRLCFSWLPTPLYALVSSIFMVFAIIVAIQVIKLLYSLLKFAADVFGGLWVKVVSYFV